MTNVVTHGRSATKGELRGKAALVAAVNGVRDLSGLPLAFSLGVTYEMLKAYASPSRPNLPPVEVLEAVADRLDEVAKEHSRTLRQAAASIRRERERGGE